MSALPTGIRRSYGGKILDLTGGHPVKVAANGHEVAGRPGPLQHVEIRFGQIPDDDRHDDTGHPHIMLTPSGRRDRLNGPVHLSSTCSEQSDVTASPRRTMIVVACSTGGPRM
jgi:hypothetical protein